MSEYIPIREFAKRINVSRQAVYKRLDKDLKGYIVRDGKKLKINTDAIYMIDTKIKQPDSGKSQKDSDLAPSADVSTLVPSIDKQVSDLIEIVKSQSKTIETLMAEIEKMCKRPPSLWQRIFARKIKETKNN